MARKPPSRLTRRALAAAIPLAGALAQQSSPPVRLPRKVRVGMAGLEAHPNIVLGVLPRMPDVELVAVADPRQEATAAVVKRPGFGGARQYTDFRRMLDREELDVVGVATPNGSRAEAVIACAEHGVHVAAEKPLALNRKDLERIKRMVKETGTKLTMFLPMRFSPWFLAVKDVVAGGGIGEVLQISSQKSYVLGKRPDWMKRRESYGGTIPWIGVHMIDLMRWTSGRDFTSAFSMTSRVGFSDIGDMENVTASIFQLDNDGLATLRMDYLRPSGAASHGDDRLRLAGTEGVVEYQASTGVTLLADGEKTRNLPDLPPERDLFVEFLQAVYAGGAQPISLSDIYRVCEITLAAQASAEQGKLIGCS